MCSSVSDMFHHLFHGYIYHASILFHWFASSFPWCLHHVPHIFALLSNMFRWFWPHDSWLSHMFPWFIMFPSISIIIHRFSMVFTIFPWFSLVFPWENRRNPPPSGLRLPGRGAAIQIAAQLGGAAGGVGQGDVLLPQHEVTCGTCYGKI